MSTETDEAMDSMPNKITLHAKQAMRFRAARGSRLTVIRGVVSIHEPPAWLSEHMNINKLSLRDGESFELQSAGWVSVEAREGAELFCVAPESWRAKLRTYVEDVIGRMPSRDAPSRNLPTPKS